MTLWKDPDQAAAVLRAVNTKLDGKPTANSSAKRTRRQPNPLMEYAVLKRVLPAVVNTARTKADSAIDKRCLISPAHTAALLGWIYGRPRSGKRLHAFFTALRYCGFRPEGAVALRMADFHLPKEGWSEVIVHTATPEIGRHWTDSGKRHDQRPLKGREVGDTRSVPVHPDVVRILRAHVTRDQLKPADLMFKGDFGGVVYRRAWSKARKDVLTPHEYASPLGKRVYDNRNTCLTEWLNNGTPPAQVAEWAGTRVALLLSTYAKVIDGQAADALKRLTTGVTVAALPEG